MVAPIIMAKINFQNKTCFIITPIGSPNSEVRRKANGLIDSVILPVLTNELNFKEENINIPHRTYDTGSITKQVLECIINDDLAIANLTGLNPNVMYELAVRHAIRLPIVTLMENGTELPFDISDERTLFYENDMADVSNLKPRLKKITESAMQDDKPDNPIYRVLTENKILSDIQEDSPNAYIMKRLSKIENMIMKNNKHVLKSDSPLCNHFIVNIDFEPPLEKNRKSKLIEKILNINDVKDVFLKNVTSGHAKIEIITETYTNFDTFTNKIYSMLGQTNIKITSISGGQK